MECLQEKLEKIHRKINDYFVDWELPDLDQDEVNFAFDIECCPTDESKEEMFTYSLSFMSCDIPNNICYNFNDVSYTIDMLLSMKCKKVNLYAHNCSYDMKPMLIDFISRYGNNQKETEYYSTVKYDYFNKEKKKLNYIYNGVSKKMKPFQYDIIMKDGIFYKLTLKSETTEVNFFDTYKLVPYSLKSCCSSFLNLDLGKDGLDYDKIRTPGEKLTNEEKIYIYDDVYGLSYLVRLLKFEGITLSGKTFKFTKLTNSGQSLDDYKDMLLHDYLEKRPPFDNFDFNEYVENTLYKNGFFALKLDKEKEYNQAKELIFESVYPKESYFQDAWERHSYYGGLCTDHKEHVAKFSKRKEKVGKVFDVNSLYPSRMKDCLLPYGIGNYNRNPYCEMDKEYKKQYPLYIQEITIYDIEVKKNKMFWLQVKDNTKFNGVEVQKNNIVDGEKVPIKLKLTNVLLDLLFECYNVKSYELGGHIGYRGTHNLFKTYIDFWGEIKRTQKGAGRNLAKLRQNGLYGKFGMSGVNEVTNINIVDEKFTVEHIHEEVVSDSVYLPMASFITSYAKEWLVKAINANYSRFMYCDTDSIHLYGLEDPKGIEVHPTKYGAWDNEMDFNDFKYIGAKRYAEKDIKTNKWNIKCCGLTDNIMSQVDDISVFDFCKLSKKEIEELPLYTKEGSVYYYYDKDCSQKIVGLIRSNKMKIVRKGSCMIEQPYKLTERIYFR